MRTPESVIVRRAGLERRRQFVRADLALTGSQACAGVSARVWLPGVWTIPMGIAERKKAVKTS